MQVATFLKMLFQKYNSTHSQASCMSICIIRKVNPGLNGFYIKNSDVTQNGKKFIPNQYNVRHFAMTTF